VCVCACECVCLCVCIFNCCLSRLACSQAYQLMELPRSGTDGDDLPRSSTDGDDLGETVTLTFRRVDSSERHFTVLGRTNSSAALLKAILREKSTGLWAVPDARIRLLFRGVELPDDCPLAKHLPAAAAASMGVVDLQFLIVKGEANVLGGCGAGLERLKDVPCPEELEATIKRCNDGLHEGVEPVMANGGTGGVYFLRGGGNSNCIPLAVFKPKDEEAGSPLNPNGYEGQENSRGLKPGVPSAHRAAREVAAYILDSRGSASSVPMTTLARGQHHRFAPLQGEGGGVVWKIGAVQAFMNTSETSDNFGRQTYSVSDVHRVGILDVRIANSDRNYGNLLVLVGGERPRQQYKLIPIDHGCSLPDRLGISYEDVVWMDWPQARRPFDEETRAFIAQLDGASDAEDLEEKLGLERHGLRMLQVTTLWLQFAARRGCTLRDIGVGLYRTHAEAGPSEVEKLIDQCVTHAFSVRSFRRSAAAGADSDGDDGGLARTSTYTPAAEPRIFRRESDGIFVRRDASGTELKWTEVEETDFIRQVTAGLQRLAETTEPRPEIPEPPRRAYIPPHLRNRVGEPVSSATHSIEP